LKVGVGLLEGVDEKPASWLRESVEAFASVPTVTEAAYFRRLLQTLLALGARGECLIVGRGAVHLLPQATTLRVRLTARLEDRIAVMSRELGVSPHEAARHVDKSDRERARFIKDHFQKDPSDPQHYDLVLNSSRFSVEECGQLIIEALRRLQARSAGAAATAPVA
jgi:cytidylate kinase